MEFQFRATLECQVYSQNLRTREEYVERKNGMNRARIYLRSVHRVYRAGNAPRGFAEAAKGCELQPRGDGDVDSRAL